MTYVMSDIHGMYGKYLIMLGRIDLKKEDTLYILGDVIDRGNEPMKVLLDMMERPNIIPLMGNHELMAIEVLEMIYWNINDDGTYSIPLEQEYIFENALYTWMRNGCMTTIESFCALPSYKCRDVLDYIQNFEYVKTVNIGETEYILVHAGFLDFEEDKSFTEYTPEELTWCRHNPDERYWSDEKKIVIAGHTPTLVLTGKAEIIHGNGNIMIDCGACQRGGRLACLRLEDMREFYV